ncbi:YutD family protein [Lacticaseibacillus baoqingensis]|uniref:YutD family protein n=1 Tax=Lacticaseibacillus baoqingensis TaxID=2486013 RepID=A0ABW4E9A4_9LACO|nr:YutD family protein [Lacticaseibacillus baoqingensis]
MPKTKSNQSKTPQPAVHEVTPLVDVAQVAPDMVTISGRRYQIVQEYKRPFDREAFAKRYTEILDKYDYVVGDWGYDQLRLKGFYANDSRHASKGQMISTLGDYLAEYCNFGCAYFVIQRLDVPEPKPRRRPRRDNGRSRRRNNKRPNKPYQERQTTPATVTGQAQTVAANQPRKRHFTIRKRESNEK